MKEAKNLEFIPKMRSKKTILFENDESIHLIQNAVMSIYFNTLNFYFSISFSFFIFLSIRFPLFCGVKCVELMQPTRRTHKLTYKAGTASRFLFIFFFIRCHWWWIHYGVWHIMLKGQISLSTSSHNLLCFSNN